MNQKSKQRKLGDLPEVAQQVSEEAAGLRLLPVDILSTLTLGFLG